MGPYPNQKAVIIKVKYGIYQHDGWMDKEKTIFRYSFKAKKGNIDKAEKANAVLIEQPKKRYPVILMMEAGSSWLCCGVFDVTEIGDKSVYLAKR